MNTVPQEMPASQEQPPADSKESSAFDALLNVLISVPVEDVRAKLQAIRKPLEQPSEGEASSHKDSD